MGLPIALEQLIGIERLALLREVTLMPRDLAPVVPAVAAGDHVVVLVHGFMASAGVFRPLRRRLEREAGARVATFTQPPGPGVRRLAHRLARLVDRLPSDVRVTIVGHSLGGLIARWYVQELGGHRRVAQTISMATPFGGVLAPKVLVGADMRPGSALLQCLREGAAACRVPHTSIVAADDSLVVGVGTASLGCGDVVVVPDRGHNALLFCDRVGDIVLSKVRDLDARHA
jgi:triacylglycerol lipase